MKTNLVKPSRVDFEKADIGQIGRILATGDLDSLPEEQRAYYDLMEMVRGLRAPRSFLLSYISLPFQ